MRTLLCAAALALSVANPMLHPSLAPTSLELERVWANGYRHASEGKTMKGALKIAQRESKRSNPRTVVKITVDHPRLLAFSEGFNAGKRSVPVGQSEGFRARLPRLSDGPPRTLTFHGRIETRPRRDFTRRLRGKADPSGLKGVRVELRVGGRTYQPVEQPDDLAVHEEEGQNIRREMVTSDVRKKGRNGRWHTETSTFTYPVKENYRWYRGAFDVVFELYDPEGRPVITDQDEAMTVTVILPSGEYLMKYALAPWGHAYDK